MQYTNKITKDIERFNMKCRIRKRIVKRNENTCKFRSGQGVRQGYTISPKLFTQTLESVFKKLDWIHGARCD